jgi:hypothetical protein
MRALAPASRKLIPLEFTHSQHHRRLNVWNVKWCVSVQQQPFCLVQQVRVGYGDLQTRRVERGHATTARELARRRALSGRGKLWTQESCLSHFSNQLDWRLHGVPGWPRHYSTRWRRQEAAPTWVLFLMGLRWFVSCPWSSAWDHVSNACTQPLTHSHPSVACTLRAAMQAHAGLALHGRGGGGQERRAGGRDTECMQMCPLSMSVVKHSNTKVVHWPVVAGRLT